MTDGVSSSLTYSVFERRYRSIYCINSTNFVLDVPNRTPAEIRSTPCICTHLNVLYARIVMRLARMTTAGFKCSFLFHLNNILYKGCGRSLSRPKDYFLRICALLVPIISRNGKVILFVFLKSREAETGCIADNNR